MESKPVFSQSINWFKLRPSKGRIFQIPSFMYFDKPVEYTIEHGDKFYSLNEMAGYQPIDPDASILRRLILQEFKKTLAGNHFSFKGAHQDIAYWDKRPFSQPHNDIFSMHTASFEFRVVSYFTGEQEEFFLVINPHLVFLFNISIAGLVDLGVPNAKLANHAVRVVVEEEDGRVSGIDGFLLETFQEADNTISSRVLHARDGSESVFAAKKVYLEPRPEIINSMLKELGRRYDVISLQREHSFLKSQSASRDRLEKTRKIVNFLIEDTKIFPLNFGEFTVDLSPEPLLIGGSGFPRVGLLPEPTLLFDKSDSSATHLQPYWGLRTYGPYSKGMTGIKVALLGSKSGVPQLKNMVEQMNHGSSTMPDGIPRFYYTKLEIIDSEIITDESVEGYIEGARRIVAKSQKQVKPDVVLVQINKTSDFDLDTPYYNVKPFLLSYDLPSQMVTPQALTKAQWIHGNIGNAIFAKAHAYPWVLAEDIPDFDMIMGVSLSQAISKTKRAGARPRYLGYANVFDELGRWMFFESTPLLYDSEHHEEQLSQLVETAVGKYHQLKGELPRSIAIHYYKRFGRREKERVREMLSNKVGEHRVAFITIDKSHPMRLYDLQNREGCFSRASYAQLSEREVLLCTTGLTELGKKRLGTPLVLRIAFDQYPEPFTSAESIAKQILALTRINYKTLSPIVGEPVTLLFANLIANFMAAFSEGEWDKALAAPAHKLNMVPWFL